MNPTRCQRGAARILARAAVAAAGLLLSAAVVRGQTSQPATGPALIPYADPAFGFELQVPSGWRYDRTRFQQFEGSIGLLRGNSPNGQRGLQVVVFRSFQMKPFEEWIVDFGKAVAEKTQAPKIDWETIQLPPRAGAVLSYTTKFGGTAMRNHSLCLPFDPNTVWILTYNGTVLGAGDEERLRGEFDQLVATVRVHYDAELAERMTPAFDRGRELLARLRNQSRDVRPDEESRTCELFISGQPVGYLERRVTREEYVFSAPGAPRRAAKEGLCVREWTWWFSTDGTVRVARLFAFTSLDFRSEMIEYEQLQASPGSGPPVTKMDQVVREDDVLFSSYTTSLDPELPPPGKPLSVGPVYLDLAWTRVLPGLLLSLDPDLYAFAVYNTETRALLMHSVQRVGEREVPGYKGRAFAFEVHDGFVQKPSTLIVDERGNLLRFDAGDVVLQYAPRDTIERKYGAQRDAARTRLGLRGP